MSDEETIDEQDIIVVISDCVYLEGDTKESVSDLIIDKEGEVIGIQCYPPGLHIRYDDKIIFFFAAIRKDISLLFEQCIFDAEVISKKGFRSFGVLKNIKKK